MDLYGFFKSSLPYYSNSSKSSSSITRSCCFHTDTAVGNIVMCNSNNNNNSNSNNSNSNNNNNNNSNNSNSNNNNNNNSTSSSSNKKSRSKYQKAVLVLLKESAKKECLRRHYN
ncbi:hypothetical protein Emed_002581 [Eimeria media]